MPIFLKSPEHNPSGVDGEGNNRMAISALQLDECALMPKNEIGFWDSLDTRKAKYGNFKPCLNEGRCSNCPILTKQTHLDCVSFDSGVIRVSDKGEPFLMNRQESGWEQRAKRLSWDFISMLQGFSFKKSYDEFGRIILIVKQ